MKYALCTMAAIFVLGYSTKAQTADLTQFSRQIINVKAVFTDMDLMVRWTSAESNANYWEVQGSADGKKFTTIGMVMGADPKDNSTYTFRQKIGKLKPGLTYFRVLHVETDSTAEVSNIIQSVK